MRVEGFVPNLGTTANTGIDILSKLNPGDIVRAQVLENSGNELTLKLFDGSKIAASTMNPVNAAEGEFVNFVYKGTVDDKPALEVANRNVQPQVDAELDNIKNSLTTLKVPVTDRNIELALALKGQNIPVTSDSMSKIIDLVNQNTQLKPDAAAFLTAANMSTDKNSIEKLQSLLAGRLKISNDIGELTKLINNDSNSSTTEVKSTIINTILEKLAAEVVAKGINQLNGGVASNKAEVIQNSNANSVTNTSAATITNGNSANTAITSSAANSNIAASTNSAPNTNITTSANSTSAIVNNAVNSNLNPAATSSANVNNLASASIEANSSSNAVGSSANNIITQADNNSTSNIKDNNVATGAKNQAATNSIDSKVTGSSNNNSSNVTQQISNMLKDGVPLGNTDLPLLRSLSSLLESMVNRGELSTEEQSAAKLIAKEIGIEIFKIQSKEAASDQESSSSKKLKGFEDSVNNLKTLFVKIDQDSDEINPVKLYKNIDAALQTLKASIHQLPSGMQEAAMNIATNLESNVNFINQLNNYSSYVQIPLSIFQQNTTGELYMLKKGSKTRKLDPSKMTILLSLDSNNIGRIDTLLSIDNKNVSTNFRLESSEVFEVIKENHKSLYTSLLE